MRHDKRDTSRKQSERDFDIADWQSGSVRQRKRCRIDSPGSAFEKKETENEKLEKKANDQFDNIIKTSGGAQRHPRMRHAEDCGCSAAALPLPGLPHTAQLHGHRRASSHHAHPHCAAAPQPWSSGDAHPQVSLRSTCGYSNGAAPQPFSVHSCGKADIVPWLRPCGHWPLCGFNYLPSWGT